jgi:hypothetical protein
MKNYDRKPTTNDAGIPVPSGEYYIHSNTVHKIRHRKEEIL